eukprot:CAMPEP_0113661942 /NCGR_PEP_ID=MMETSP0038_2-20120614/282_1 /TAXON_ID=2898 /ORGANISM="Cryptomonas paramecium" /LENGTH=136 /DNA_ID=CAMNT_0000576745 /DNA_START=173 /DNA_END=580 /DNA_ORIENTATION=+ /assembly_acc=CAM_ASM_000170
MDPQVAIGFVHQAAREKVYEDITFPRLVKILYPKLASYYRDFQPTTNKKQGRQKQHREEVAAAVASGQVLDVEDILNSQEISELRELYRLLNNGSSSTPLSVKVVVEAFKRNGLCSEAELSALLGRDPSGAGRQRE